MAVIVVATAAGAVLAVLLLPALMFRWTGDWWCTPYIAPEPVRARELEGTDARR